MAWLTFGRAPRRSPPPAPEPDPVRVARSIPGLATLFGEISLGDRHSVLDLGAASESSLRVHSRYAGWIRFADFPSEPVAGEEIEAALAALPSQPDRPYDLIFAWDVADRLPPKDRSRLAARLTEISAPDARLHMVVNSPEKAVCYPLRFTLLDDLRVWWEPASASPLPPGRILPREAERLLVPFRVTRGLTLKGGFREYLARRGEG